MENDLHRQLRELSVSSGIQTSYFDVQQRRQTASDEALLLGLKALGVPVNALHDVPEALRQERLRVWKRPLEPVIVCWGTGLPRFDLRLPSVLWGHLLSVQVHLEGGEVLSWVWEGPALPEVSRGKIDGEDFTAKLITLPVNLPFGYHELMVEVGNETVRALLICAPLKAYRMPGRSSRAWGVFAPLYALHDDGGWPSGDLSDLRKLIHWTGGLGGKVVGTLPLLATSLDKDSPYEPMSRLMWNEFYIDIASVPEFAACKEARQLVDSGGFQKELGRLRGQPLVEVERERRLRRDVLKELCRCFFRSPGPRHRGFDDFVKTHPFAADYARFRAAVERGDGWARWPERQREGWLEVGDYDPDAERYYLYTQWTISEQMAELFDNSHSGGLYLDLPLGVDPQGYDVWRFRDVFARDSSGGAPPDAVFTGGQDWGFPPLHPRKIREQGYKYYIACLRHHLQPHGFLRLDHVMSFHRLYWIPKGLAPRNGVYVRYHDEEFYALLNIESHRKQCVVVGENLGTVPAYINRALRTHGISRMHVIQYELAFEASQRALVKAPSESVASLNTHDMPTFAGFWEGSDIKQRHQMGLLGETGAIEETEARARQKEALVQFLSKKGLLSVDGGVDAILEALLVYLAGGRPQMVLANLEDLWLEKDPQNVPGSQGQYPNWRRRTRYSIEEFTQLPRVVEILKAVNNRRHGRSPRT